LEGHSHASWRCLDLRYGHGYDLETYLKDLWTLFEHCVRTFCGGHPFL